MGQSWDLKSRLSHYKNLHCKRQPGIYNSLAKYGVETHEFRVLVTYHQKNLQGNLDWLEVLNWHTLKTEGFTMLNSMQPFGSHGKHGEESKQKMSALNWMRGKPIPDALRNAIITANRNRPEEVKRKFSKSWVGRKHTSESKSKISRANSGRSGVRGDANTKAKLTSNEVIDIWRMLCEGYKQCDISKMFSVSRNIICDIKQGNTWNHITGAKKSKHLTVSDSITNEKANQQSI